MSELTRFSVSLDQDLLDHFDRQSKQQGYPTRSKAVADLIRASLVQKEWQGGREVAAAIILVYDHHKRELTGNLTHVQHDHYKWIVSSQHIHLDHHNCLEVIIAKGPPAQIRKLADQLRGIKGVKFTSLAAASTGEQL